MLDRYLAGDWFPSPYGVIFILTLWSKPSYDYEDIMEFPSSYGVSFIII